MTRNFHQRLTRLAFAAFPAALSTILLLSGPVAAQAGEKYFQRIATFPVFLNICETDDQACISEASFAEILTPSEDGQTIIYIGKHEDDGIVGFVNIADPNNPQPAGVVVLEGEPTSVAVAGPYALVAVNTREDFVNVSGQLVVINIATHAVVRTMELGGQPDSIAVSPDKKYAAIIIENERDEDYEPTDGAPPQLPAGYLVIVDLGGKKFNPKKGWETNPAGWSLRTVALTGYADKFPTDPEPEYVDINSANQAVLTLQENNHIIIVNLVSGTVIADFPAGEVDLTQVDIDNDGLIEQAFELNDVPREPDGVAWISPSAFATADEGDLDGGSRGFTIYDKDGNILFAAGNTLEHIMARVGHYPEDRSDNKGGEPESSKFDVFDGQPFLFIGSERSSTVTVYKMDKKANPVYHQVLPGGLGPEGLTTFASRGLLMTSSEEDDRAATFRGVITIYQLKDEAPNYPTLISSDRPDGTPIPWSGLSALAADRIDPNKAYTIYDSYYPASRIFVLDMSQTPPLITDEIVLNEGGSTVDLDPEGLAVRSDGTFWLATEGAGNCNGVTCPGSAKPNQLIEVDTDGTVLSRVSLPASLNLQQRSNGFEGVAVTGTAGADEVVYVAFQRAWTAAGDADGLETRIGRYDVAADEWTFAYYPLDSSETSNPGDWIGLSELTAIGPETFVVIERDKQAGLDAYVKRLYAFSTSGVTFMPHGEALETLDKTLVRDVLADLAAPKGAVIEKLEGFMVLGTSDSWIVTDNDGVEDSAGETQLINLGNLGPIVP